MLWQTKKWGKMLVDSKQAEKIYEIDGVYIEKRKVAMGEYGLFIIDDNVTQKYNVAFFVKLIDLVKKEKCLFIQIERVNYIELSRFFNPNFSKGYYKKFIVPYTAVIDLEQSEEDILKNMKPKGRYNIRLAEKKGVECKIVEKTQKNISEFYNLMMETTSRDGFSGNLLQYYITFLQDLDNSELILAYKDDVVISAGIFTFTEENTIYYYGASISDKKYRNLMAPYLVQWTAILEAKKRGSKIYDFLGVATPGDTNSSLAGVTDFKFKLTPDVRKVSDSYIYVNKKFKYSLIKFLRFLKNKK